MLKGVTLSVGVWLVLPLLSCHSASMRPSPGVTFPLPISEKAPAFLFPVNLSHLNLHGGSSSLEDAAAMGIAAKFGAAVISGQPFSDLVGSLSYELAETIDNEVRHGTFMTSKAGTTMAARVADVMERVVFQLVNLGVLKSPIAFRYLIVIHSHGEPDMSDARINVNSWGGIYDTEIKQVMAYVSASDTYAKEEKALRDQLVLAYNDLIEKLINGAKK